MSESSVFCSRCSFNIIGTTGLTENQCKKRCNATSLHFWVLLNRDIERKSPTKLEIIVEMRSIYNRNRMAILVRRVKNKQL